MSCGLSAYPDPADNTLCVNYSSPDQKLAGIPGSAWDATQLNTGNTAWMLAATALVMIMTPGVGFFYGGMMGEESAVNTIMMSMVAMAIVSMQWVVCGYSFAFGPGSAYFGGVQYIMLNNVGENLSGGYGVGIPHIIYAIFQCMFAMITPALISGSVVGRMKFTSFCLFVLIWTTLIYDPLAHWVWAFAVLDDYSAALPSGWLGKLGAIDFAGGTVIHISSGFAGLASAIMLGKRKNQDLKPHNVPLVILGTTMLWFGWFGFNAGSAAAANGIATVAFTTTHFATATGFVSWMLIEFIFERKMSASGACAGAVAALVAVTPGCGFVEPYAAFFFGLFPAIFCYASVKVRTRIGVDDTLDAFSVHGVGGVVGAILTGFFATTKVNPFSGANAAGVNGLVYGNGQLVLYQLAAVCTSASYSFFGTLIILFIMSKTIGIRVSEEHELKGLDSSLHGGDSYNTKAISSIAPRGDSEDKEMA